MSWVRRINVGLTPAAAEALDRLSGRDRTDAVCRALRVADLVERYTTGDGKVTLIRPDNGETVQFYVF